MRKPTTGEPCAGEPHARFGGRGGESLPYPYRRRAQRRYQNIAPRGRKQDASGF